MSDFTKAVARVDAALQAHRDLIQTKKDLEHALGEAEKELADARQSLFEAAPELVGSPPALLQVPNPPGGATVVEVDDPDAGPPDLGAGPMVFRERS